MPCSAFSHKFSMIWQGGGAVRRIALELLQRFLDLLADVGLRRDQLPTLALELADEKERDRALAAVFQPELQPCG